VKRVLLAALAAGLLALGASAPAVADPPGGVDPSCADIISGGGGTIMLPPAFPVPTATGSVETLTPTCKSVNYTVVVSYTSNGVQQVATFTKKGGNDRINDTGNGLVKFAIPLSATVDNYGGTSPLACIASFTSRGDNILDASPDASQFTAPPTPATNCANGAWVEINDAPPGSGGGFPG
jgi:hypothetical protein